MIAHGNNVTVARRKSRESKAAVRAINIPPAII
jgi:hypothetical protein